MAYKTDIEIAQECTMAPILEIAKAVIAQIPTNANPTLLSHLLQVYNV